MTVRANENQKLENGAGEGLEEIALSALISGCKKAIPAPKPGEPVKPLPLPKAVEPVKPLPIPRPIRPISPTAVPRLAIRSSKAGKLEIGLRELIGLQLQTMLVENLKQVFRKDASVPPLNLEALWEVLKVWRDTDKNILVVLETRSKRQGKTMEIEGVSLSFGGAGSKLTVSDYTLSLALTRLDVDNSKRPPMAHIHFALRVERNTEPIFSYGFRHYALRMGH
jgi:hypothetical protein